MRTRSGAFAAALCGVVAVAAPAAASAAPRHDHGLTITTSANPITDGQGVEIYGQLTGPNLNDQPIKLYHKIAPADRFTYVQTVYTNSSGYYQFNRADGVVSTNRDWFVLGPDGTHSRTVDENVHAQVSLNESTQSATTRNYVHFTGSVDPSHRNEPVLIQVQGAASGNTWYTVAEGRTNRFSDFSIYHRFRNEGDYTLRAYFPRDARNIGSPSDSVTLSVQQAENPNFTIGTLDQRITDGQSVNITGTLAGAGNDHVPVILFGKTVGGRFVDIAPGMTDGSGNYTFTQSPSRNMVYYVRTADRPYRHTSALYIGVADVLTFGTTTTGSVQEGQAVTFTGSVTPDHSGHLIYLQQQEPNGSWQNIAVSTVNGANYSFTYRFDQFGSLNLRARIYGGPVNIGAASAPVTVNVSGTAAASTLPAAPAS